MSYIFRVNSGKVQQKFGEDYKFLCFASSENQIELLEDYNPFGIFSSNNLSRQDVSHGILQSNYDSLPQKYIVSESGDSEDHRER